MIYGSTSTRLAQHVARMRGISTALHTEIQHKLFAVASSITQTVVQIDGSFCEGGGQLLRNAVALSALISKPISISNVRHNRRPPGLRKQHEAGINLAASICCAVTNGVEVDSTAIDFRPGPIQLPKTLTADPGTAGSTTLLLQVALPCLLFSPTNAHDATSTLFLHGGTNATLAPQIDYTQSILFPFLARHCGLAPTLTVFRRGYFPKGGGLVACVVPAVERSLPPVVLTERGRVTAVRGTARVGGLPRSIAQRMVSGAHRALLARGIPASRIALESARERDADVVGAGGGILLWAETVHGCLIAGSAVSSKEKTPEAVGEAAARELLRNLDHGGCVDEYLQDQMIIFLALAEGRSVVKTGPVTDHTRTAIHVAQLMTGAQFHLDENGLETIITCEGIGFVPSPATAP